MGDSGALFERFMGMLDRAAATVPSHRGANFAPVSQHEIDALLAPIVQNPEESAQRVLEVIREFYENAAEAPPGLCEDVDPMTGALECFLFDPLCIKTVMGWLSIEIHFCNPLSPRALGGWPPMCPCEKNTVWFADILLIVGMAVLLAGVGAAIARSVNLLRTLAVNAAPVII